jgi:large subunit ribosomal protein L23
MSIDTDFYDLLRRPIITEKATNASENGAVVFEVSMKASKSDIKKAVEELFKVKVKGVNTLISKGKIKRFKGRMGRRKNIKKAYVMLEDGNTIDVSTGL